MLRNIRPLLTQSRAATSTLRPLVFSSSLCRNYARSRFPEHAPGSSRTRDRPERISPRERPKRASESNENPLAAEGDGNWRDVKLGPFTFRVWENSKPFSRGEQAPLEQQSKDTSAETPRSSQPEQEESPLWQASQRPPASDPEEGLHRLLMDNDLLVVTRYAHYITLR